MTEVAIEDLFYRNKRIREFMQKFREKDRANVMRDIALLGIEIFEDMNEESVHVCPDDVENTLATYVVDKWQKKRMSSMIAKGNTPSNSGKTINLFTQPGPQQMSNTIMPELEYQQIGQRPMPMYNNSIPYNNYLQNEDNTYNLLANTQNKQWDQYGQTYNWNNQAHYNNFLDNPGLWQNYQAQRSQVQPNVGQTTSQPIAQKSAEKSSSQKRSLNPMNKAVPAGIPSYLVYQDSDDEAKARERSPNKWRMDDSTYEPKAAKYKLNRQSTEDLQNTKPEKGKRYPKWWGDGSAEKPNQHSQSMVQPNTDLSIQHQQKSVQVDEHRTQQSRSSLVPENVSQQINSSSHPDGSHMSEKYDHRDWTLAQELLKDKRMESVPKPQESHHTNSTTPLKSVLRNAEGTRAKGGVALHYNMQDLWKYNRPEDDRPISPAQNALPEKGTNDRRDRETRKKLGLTHNYQDFSYSEGGQRNTSPLKSQNLSMKELILRDKQIAIQRRKRLEDARSKGRMTQAQDQFASSMRNYENRSSSSHQFGRKQRSSTSTKLDRSISPTSGARRTWLKRRTQKPAQDEGESDTYNDTFARDTNHQRETTHTEQKHKYYRQEDIIKEASFSEKGTKDKLKEMLRGSDSQVKSPPKIDLQQASSHLKVENRPHEEAVSEPFSDRVSESHKIMLGRDKPGIAKHANSVIDRHHNRLKQYGLGIPKDHMYPYNSDNNSQKHQ